MGRKTKWKIGDRVRSEICYPRDCKERHRERRNDGKRCISKDPVPIGELRWIPGVGYRNGEQKNRPIKGIVVGIRNVIMDDYDFHPDHDGWMGYATGKREDVLLVAENAYREPIIVRFCDAVKEEE